MNVSPVYIAMSIVGGLGVLVVLVVVGQLREWPFPVRRRTFHFDMGAVADALTSRGASGQEPEGDAEAAEAAAGEDAGEAEAEEEEAEAEDAEQEGTLTPESELPSKTREPQSLWDRLKPGLYTYQKRAR